MSPIGSESGICTSLDPGTWTATGDAGWKYAGTLSVRTAAVSEPSWIPLTTAMPVPAALRPVPLPITTSTPGTRPNSLTSSRPLRF